MKIAMSTQPLPETRPGLPSMLVLSAATSFAAAVCGAMLLGGRVARQSPIEAFGAAGVAWASAFNLFAFVLPGALVGALAAIAYLCAGSARVRIGGWMLLLSALSFAGQGLLVLDPARPETSGRLHALCWSLWWLTTAAGATVAGLRQRHRLGAWPGLHVLVALLVPAIALFGPPILGVAVAQRFAYGLWFAWWWLAARAYGDLLSDSAASAPGSSRRASG